MSEYIEGAARQAAQATLNEAMGRIRAFLKDEAAGLGISDDGSTQVDGMLGSDVLGTVLYGDPARRQALEVKLVTHLAETQLVDMIQGKTQDEPEDKVLTEEELDDLADDPDEDELAAEA